jgi:hypothetical protein
MPAETFEEAWKKAPENIKNFLEREIPLYIDKYFDIFEINWEDNIDLMFNFNKFLKKIGIKYYDVPNLYTLHYLCENVLNIDKEFAKKLADVLWNDFMPTLRKVWEGEEIITQPIEKEERLQKAILAQMEREKTEAEASAPKIESEAKIEEAVSVPIPIEIKAEEKKETPMPVEVETEEIKKVPSIEIEVREEEKQEKIPEEIPFIEVPVISWEEEKKEEVSQQPEIIVEEKKEEEKKKEEGPIDVSSF